MIRNILLPILLLVGLFGCSKGKSLPTALEREIYSYLNPQELRNIGLIDKSRSKIVHHPFIWSHQYVVIKDVKGAVLPRGIQCLEIQDSTMDDNAFDEFKNKNSEALSYVQSLRLKKCPITRLESINNFSSLIELELEQLENIKNIKANLSTFPEKLKENNYR